MALPSAAMPGMSSILSSQLNMPQAPQGGMFGGGGKFGLKEALAFGLAGLVSRQNPGLMQGLMAAMMQKQRTQQEEAQYQRQRADSNADFQAHRQYEINNPMPGQPGEFESALAATGVMPGTPEYAHAEQQRVSNMLDPVVMTPQGPMLRSQVLSGAQTGTPAPQGVTFSPLPEQGGSTPQASGGFPGY